MNRWIWTFIIVVCILVLLGFIGYSCGRWDYVEQKPWGLASAETMPCTDRETTEKIRGIMLESLDHALEKQIVHVFEIWMKDDRDQPARARIGVQQAVRAYIGSRKGVVDWQPVVCP